MTRLTITLDDRHAEKLSRLAERAGVSSDTMASRLLLIALDEADPGAGSIVELLDRIPGAHDRAQLGLVQARSGQTVSLDDL